jgi:hypothetical protein
MGDRIRYVGLDVHKADIVIAVAEDGLRGEVREYGRIANTPAAVARLTRKLSSDGVRLRFCYEAGPCGYGIQRQLSALGHECAVVAPSLIPKRAGDRIKTDRRDAASLARLDRAGELTAVWVPDAGHSGASGVHFLQRVCGRAVPDAPERGDDQRRYTGCDHRTTCSGSRGSASLPAHRHRRSNRQIPGPLRRNALYPTAQRLRSRTSPPNQRLFWTAPVR